MWSAMITKNILAENCQLRKWLMMMMMINSLAKETCTCILIYQYFFLEKLTACTIYNGVLLLMKFLAFVVVLSDCIGTNDYSNNISPRCIRCEFKETWWSYFQWNMQRSFSISSTRLIDTTIIFFLTWQKLIIYIANFWGICSYSYNYPSDKQ